MLFEVTRRAATVWDATCLTGTLAGTALVEATVLEAADFDVDFTFVLCTVFFAVVSDCGAENRKEADANVPSTSETIPYRASERGRMNKSKASSST